MRLVTQCPQCALLFQVPEQPLDAAKGQVRCGQCGHVFEGEAFAITAPGFESPLAAESPSDSPAESLLSAPRIDVEALLRRKDVPSEPVAAPTPSVPALSSVLSAAPPTFATASSPAPVHPAEPIAVPAPSLPVKPDWRIESAAVGAARRTAWMLWGSALLLTVGLCLQSLVFFRDEIAVRWPDSRPMLEALCQPAACQVQPLRRWNGIVIDSSSLVRGDAGYVLNVTLRNSVELALAMTALELTVTDDQDRALMRRVLSPSELGAPSVLAAGQVWQRALAVEPTPTDAEIAGYRLVSFYP